MRWAEITVAAKPAAADAVASMLIEEGSRGAAIASPSASFQGEMRVCGYLPVDDLLENRLSGIKDRIRSVREFLDVDTGSLEITVRRVEEADWAEAWKAYYKPFVVGGVIVKPSWEKADPRNGQVVVELDPGMAFGTGQHPTTQLCLQLLQQCIFGGEVVADIGTGSGILAITAAKLGASRVYAIDRDTVAVEVAIRNVRRNGMEDVISVEEGDSLLALPEPVDVIVANILPDVIMMLAPQASGVLKPGGEMISSGIIDEREADVAAGLESCGLKTLSVQRDGSWVAFRSRR